MPISPCPRGPNENRSAESPLVRVHAQFLVMYSTLFVLIGLNGQDDFIISHEAKQWVDQKNSKEVALTLEPNPTTRNPYLNASANHHPNPTP